MHTIDDVGWKPKVKLITDFDIIFSLDHEVTILCDSESFKINPNEAFLACPGQSVYIQPEPDVKTRTGVTVLHFAAQNFYKKSFSDVMEIFRNYPFGPKHRLYLSNKLKIKNKDVKNILTTMFNELKFRRYGYKETVNHHLIGLLFELHRAVVEEIIYGKVEYNYTISNSYTRKIINYLHTNYANEIHGEHISKHLEISYDYCNLVFKRITGFTIMNYLNNIRIARAKELLKTTSLTVNEISAIVGIKDPHYFSKKFKALEGKSPSRYKKERL